MNGEEKEKEVNKIPYMFIKGLGRVQVTKTPTKKDYSNFKKKYPSGDMSWFKTLWARKHSTKAMAKGYAKKHHIPFK
jgi:hypothetical protein